MTTIGTPAPTAAETTQRQIRDARDVQKQRDMLLEVLEHFGIGVCEKCNGDGTVEVVIPGSRQWNDGDWGPEMTDIPCDAEGCYFGFARVRQ